eukprot:3199602-Pleurochrysis_carterae.AAC.1
MSIILHNCYKLDVHLSIYGMYTCVEATQRTVADARVARAGNLPDDLGTGFDQQHEADRSWIQAAFRQLTWPHQASRITVISHSSSMQPDAAQMGYTHKK